MNIVILGLSLACNQPDHYTFTFREVVRELSNRGHQLLILGHNEQQNNGENDYADQYNCQVETFISEDDLKHRFTDHVREADMVLIGAGAEKGIQFSEWVLKTAQGVKAFYDSDTPATLMQLERGQCAYLHPGQLAKYDLYLSFTGGPLLRAVEQKYGSPMARPLYYCPDTSIYFPQLEIIKWDLGYLGIYPDIRQTQIKKLMLDAAQKWPQGRFAVAGAQNRQSMGWPENVEMIGQPAQAEHRSFYNSQRFNLSLTPPNMVKSGYTPVAGLLEAAACCTPIISDYWPGLEAFFKTGEEILVSDSAKDSLTYLREICKSERKMIGERARRKVLRYHTAAHRAQELENYVEQLVSVKNPQAAFAGAVS